MEQKRLVGGPGTVQAINGASRDDLLRLVDIALRAWPKQRLHSRGNNEAAGGPNDLSGDPS